MESKFKVGDVVRLATGEGAKMTITKVHTRPTYGKPDKPTFTGIYSCAWHVNDQPYKEDYPEESLELYNVE